MVRQVGLGLQALHDHGVLHRDVKPANVLFRTPDPASGAKRGDVRAMLGDLGLGKALDMSSRLTMIAGTPTFVAPEQAQGEHLDARADQYSLAALTYLMFTGRAPYAHASLAAAAAPGEPPRLSAPGREFPDEVEAVVCRGRSRPTGRSAGPTSRRTSRRCARRSARAYVRRCRPRGCRSTRTSPSPARARRRYPTEEPLADPTPAAAPASTPAGRRRAPGSGRWPRVRPPATRCTAATRATTTVSDDSGSLSVTVPADWHGVGRPRGLATTQRAEPVRRPLGRHDRGLGRDALRAEGVFLGILPGTELPDAGARSTPSADGRSSRSPTRASWRSSVTVVYTGCPGGDLTVERVIQVADNRLLWVQVRSEDGATANSVLDSVSTHGI